MDNINLVGSLSVTVAIVLVSLVAAVVSRKRSVRTDAVVVVFITHPVRRTPREIADRIASQFPGAGASVLMKHRCQDGERIHTLVRVNHAAKTPEEILAWLQENSDHDSSVAPVHLIPASHAR